MYLYLFASLCTVIKISNFYIHPLVLAICIFLCYVTHTEKKEVRQLTSVGLGPTPNESSESLSSHNQGCIYTRIVSTHVPASASNGAAAPVLSHQSRTGFHAMIVLH